MNLIQSLIYGVISGLSEFMPISTSGHQALLRKLFGASTRNPLLDLMVGLGLLIAVYMHCRNQIAGYSRELRTTHRRRRRNHSTDVRRTYDLRFLFFAGVAMLALLLFRGFALRTEKKPLYLCLFFVIQIPRRRQRCGRHLRRCLPGRRHPGTAPGRHRFFRRGPLPAHCNHPFSWNQILRNPYTSLLLFS